MLRDLDVTGSIHVLADNVRISNVRIRQPGGIAIRQEPSNHGLVIEDVEIDGRGNPDGSEAIGLANYTLRRANIYGVGEGPRANGNVLIEDSYIHDLGNYLDQGAHQDAIQSTGGSNITIRHNRLENNVDGGNAAIMIGTSPGSNLLIEDNIVSGGGYAVYGGAYEDGGSENWTNVRIVDNRFSTKFYPQSGFYGPLLNIVGVTLSGNVWHETGRPL
ncbi:MAG: right-handed parallel beta-helix repeat-containing protein [Actinopolymorphaceae bacterium]